jgi:quercetin dioxygenase-like cupin family protein
VGFNPDPAAFSLERGETSASLVGAEVTYDANSILTKPSVQDARGRLGNDRHRPPCTQRSGAVKTKMFILVAAACGAFLLGGGVVLAGPPIGFTATIISDGKIAKATEINANGIKFSSHQNARVIVQVGDFVPGGTSGWHTHPGLTVVTVTDGSVINYVACREGVVYTKGQSFVEPPNTPGDVDNTSTTRAAHVMATLIVSDGMAPRTNVDAPKCTHEGDA